MTERFLSLKEVGERLGVVAVGFYGDGKPGHNVQRP